jgi:hypothetical protein
MRPCRPLKTNGNFTQNVRAKPIASDENTIEPKLVVWQPGYVKWCQHYNLL